MDDWKDLCTHVETISLSLFGSKGGSSSKHNIIEHKSYLAQDCGRNGLANKKCFGKKTLQEVLRLNDPIFSLHTVEN